MEANYVDHDIDKRCLEPWEYLMQTPGKNVREKLIDAFQVWLSIPQDKIEIIKHIITNLHTASLLIDDIEDNSKLRRGSPVAHSIYGVPATINSANYVYFLALQLCQNHCPDALSVFTSELLNLHRGQGQDIMWRDNNTCPTEDEYKQMVIDKTGGLFRLAVRMMQVFSSCKTDFTKLVNLLAMYFQIRDDYINLVSSDYMTNKSFCEDLTEGKFSFPIVHCIHVTAGHDTRLLHILRQRTEDVDMKRHALLWMEQAGSFEYTRSELNSLYSQINEELANLGGHPGLDRIIRQLHKEVDKDVESDSLDSEISVEIKKNVTQSNEEQSEAV